MSRASVAWFCCYARLLFQVIINLQGSPVFFYLESPGGMNYWITYFVPSFCSYHYHDWPLQGHGRFRQPHSHSGPTMVFFVPHFASEKTKAQRMAVESFRAETGQL